MTLRRASEVAAQCLPVVCGGITYLRILEVGYTYSEHGEKSSYVVLLDKCGHSVTKTKPENCEESVPENERMEMEENAHRNT